jgi:hypothetical protein
MDERLRRGIEQFNNEQFFEAHEVWEELWHEYREADRTFIQALIHLAAGFYHAQCGNEKGTISQLNKGIEKMQAYLPAHQDLAMERLLIQAGQIAERVHRGDTTKIQYPQIMLHETQPIQL